MNRRTATLSLLLITITSAILVEAQRRVPTIDDLLTIKSVGGTQISPDGKWVAYTVGYGDFKQDAFINQIWLAQAESGQSFQLTRGDRSSTNPRWSPDGHWLAFLSNRQEDKNQIFVINPAGGEAQPLTKSETAITNFAWSERRPDHRLHRNRTNAPTFERSQGLSGRLRRGARRLQLRASLDLECS